MINRDDGLFGGLNEKNIAVLVTAVTVRTG